MSPEQAEAQRQRAWRTDERKAVITAARTAIEQSRSIAGDDNTAKALRRVGTEVRDQLADLIDLQREANRHDADDRDGDALLAEWVATLRGFRDEAAAAAEAAPKGPQRTQAICRRIAYNWTIKTLRDTAQAEIATVRAEVAQAREWLARR